MTKLLNTAFAATLAAASVFGASAALAGSGDYYAGAQPTENVRIDRTTTHSIHNGNVVVKPAPSSEDVGPAHGDYYQGVSKY